MGFVCDIKLDEIGGKWFIKVWFDLKNGNGFFFNVNKVWIDKWCICLKL